MHWGLSSANYSPSAKLRRKRTPEDEEIKSPTKRPLYSSLGEQHSLAEAPYPACNCKLIFDKGTVIVCSSCTGTDGAFNRERLGGRKQIKHWDVD